MKQAVAQILEEIHQLSPAERAELRSAILERTAVSGDLRTTILERSRRPRSAPWTKRKQRAMPERGEAACHKKAVILSAAKSR